MSAQMERTGLLWSWLLWWPIPRPDQALFAEAFATSLACGLAAAAALTLSARVNPNPRFRTALWATRRHFGAGYSLAQSLKKSGAWVEPGLLVALEAGEEYGRLVEELSSFARELEPGVTRLLHQAAGRRPEATRFAAALARLLRDHRLCLELVEVAGRLAAPRDRGFASVMRTVVTEMENGEPFLGALRRQPRYFDTFYCGLLEVAESREDLQAALERLGRGT